MFQPISRIENVKGVRFYEQDILFDDYVYTDDVQIHINANFLTPGIGIALMKSEGLPLQEQKEAYLFKLGYREASVYYRNNSVQRKTMNVATALYPPKDHLEIIFTKRGRKVTLNIPEIGNLIEYNIPTEIDRYQIGIYSNAGNSVQNVSVASGIPTGWQVNMRNTEGGYLKFAKSSFQIEKCSNPAEIEQQDIDLPIGTYYLKYEKDLIGGINDLQCFVMVAGDDRITDEEKNIFIDGKIKVSEPTTVNIKFRGTQGLIKNIHITDRETDQYVATRNEQLIVDGSYILVDLENIEKVNWTGEIYEVPIFDVGSEDTLSAILISGDQTVTYLNSSVLIRESCSYEYHVEDKLFTIKRPNQTKQVALTAIPKEIKIFLNMDAAISQMTLTKTDGQVINLIAEKTSKRYVPDSINSPIVVIDADQLPLDLSSSYRIIKENGQTKYVFTNWEREVFEPSSHVHVERKISDELGAVRIWGIPKTLDIDMGLIFQIPNAAMDTLSIFCPKAQVIKLEDLAYVDVYTGQFYFRDVSAYQMIVIDYLKDNSYCINYDGITRMYEIDISNNGRECYLLYNHGGDSFSSSGVTNINSYKVTDIYPAGESYIALRREGF